MPEWRWPAAVRAEAWRKLNALLAGVGDPSIEAVFSTPGGILTLFRALSEAEISGLPTSCRVQPKHEAALARRIYSWQGFDAGVLLQSRSARIEP